jgi:hypothetical protein
MRKNGLHVSRGGGGCAVEQNEESEISLLCFAQVFLESISPTFYRRNCANILAQIKSLTFTASTKKLRAKLSYKKGTYKMLVKLTPG